MSKVISVAAGAALLFGSGAVLAESAQFETNGFPISLHQAQVTGFADIKESGPQTPLRAGGMPLSPHQLAVLSPRDTAIQVAAKRFTAGTAEASTGR